MRDPLGCTPEVTKTVVFLFGAGASYGAGDIVPERPPLGSALFAELSRVHPGTWGRLPSEIATTFKDLGFEVGMGQLFQQYSPIVAPLMQQMAVYFIQFRPLRGKSMYCRLLHYLDKSGRLERTVFSTLNYDCILEFAMLRQGKSFSYFDVDDLSTPLLKLHGSANWTSHNLKASAGIQYSSGVVFEAGIEASLDIGTVISKNLVNQGLAPVMSLYMQGKPLQVSPRSLEEIQQLWSAQVAKAAAVVLVGVRPWPADEHIWDPLAHTTAALLAVGDELEFATWADQYRTGNINYIGSRFDRSFDALTRRLEAL